MYHHHHHHMTIITVNNQSDHINVKYKLGVTQQSTLFANGINHRIYCKWKCKCKCKFNSANYESNHKWIDAMRCTRQCMKSLMRECVLTRAFACSISIVGWFAHAHTEGEREIFFHSLGVIRSYADSSVQRNEDMFWELVWCSFDLLRANQSRTSTEWWSWSQSKEESNIQNRNENREWENEIDRRTTPGHKKVNDA